VENEESGTSSSTNPAMWSIVIKAGTCRFE
jgi:hypothetical protein